MLCVQDCILCAPLKTKIILCPLFSVCVCQLYLQLLHDELARRLGGGTEVERLDALKKMSSLHLMTPQLLSVFLPCLSDEHASIRIEAISVRYSLIQGPQLISDSGV